MKKRILTILITVIIAAACAVTLFSCADKNSPSTNDPSVDIPPEKEYCEITFYVSENVYKTVTVEKGQKVSKPQEPILDGYIFRGWFSENSEKEYSFDKAVIEPLSLYAEFEKIVPTGINVAENSEHRTKFSQWEIFDSAGLKAEVTFSDGTKKVLTEGLEVDYSEYNYEKAGSYVISVKTPYGSFSYTVIVNGVVAIRLSEDTDYVKVYAEGDTIVIPETEIVYADGRIEKAGKGMVEAVSSNGGEYVSGKDGKDRVTVYLAGEEIYYVYEISVYEPTLLAPTEIFIKEPPEKTSFGINTQLDCSGLILEKTTDIFGERKFIMAETEYEIDFSDCDITKEGEYEAKIYSVADRSVYISYNVRVEAVEGEIVGLSVTEPNITRFYRFEKLDLTGIRVEKVYSDGKKVGISAEEYVVDSSAYDSSNIGECEIKVIYKENSNINAVFTVLIVENPLVGVYFTVEGAAPTYAYKIEVNNGALAGFYFDYENNVWYDTPDEIFSEELTAFERKYGNIIFGDKKMDIATETVISMDNVDNPVDQKLRDDDVLLFIDGVNGFFFMVKRGEGLSAETLETYGDIYLSYDYDTGEGRLITAEDKFTENTTVYLPQI